MLFADLVTTSEAVAATRARRTKIESLAGFLRRLSAEEIAPAVGFLTGAPRQGRIGIGWATVFGLEIAAAAAATLTIADLDGAIERIEATTGTGSAGARKEILRDLFSRATAAEADFMRRLFVGELRQGALAGIMADAIARAAEVPAAAVRRAAMLSGDLGGTARVALGSGVDGLKRVGLNPMRPVLPMLAATAADVSEALAGMGPASVEWKLDGARIQVHRVDEEVRIFTRNLNDVTERLPAVVDAVRELPVGQVILDGEAIGVDERGRPGRFQDTMSRFGTEGEPVTGGEALLKGFFFDCLHLDGTDLIDEPLSARQEALGGFAGDHRIPTMVTEDAAEAEAFLHQALAVGHEGVMVKALDSTYAAGRRGAAWRKVKPEKTLDLVVLGAEWGHGRRHGWLSNLQLGARGPAGGFVMVGKTFKGMTDEMLTWQTARFLELETSREGITVFVRPVLVVEIALDGVQASTRYPGGVALRFARVRGYRPDKDPADADTIDTVRSLLGVRAV